MSVLLIASEPRIHRVDTAPLDLIARSAVLTSRMAISRPADAPLRRDEVTEEVPIVESEVTGGPRRWFRRKRITIPIVVVVAAGGGIGIWLGTSSSSIPPLQITTQVVSVTTGTMKQTVSASGTIAPAQQANLNFGASGTVTAVNVSAGQTVTTGQTLATVDPSALQATVNSAQASLTSAQAKLASDQSASASASQIASDQASVTSAQSQLTSDQTNLDNASLTSTITGTVASVNLSVGQQVAGTSNSSGSGSGSGSASSSSSPASTGSSNSPSNSASPSASSSASSASSSSSSSSSAQIVVISTNSFVVNATVDDTQVGQVKQNDQVVITPSGSTTNVYGTVSSVGLIATQSSTVATFPVAIAVTGSPTGIYAGSTATLSIIVKQINNAVQVPTAAISYSGGTSRVTVVQNGSHVTRTVTTGVASNGETQITSGLTSGEKVLEQVVKFNGAGGAGRSLFGGSGGTSGSGFPSGGPGGGGFPGGGSAAAGGGVGG